MLREKCAELAKCSMLKEELDACNERVSSRAHTTEKCTQEVFDFVHCVDHCVSQVCVGAVAHVLLFSLSYFSLADAGCPVPCLWVLVVLLYLLFEAMMNTILSVFYRWPRTCFRS